MGYPYQITTLQAYKDAYKKSVEDPEGFWSEIASHFYWRKKWDKVLEWDFEKPTIKWFQGAKLNITENCLDRHLGLLGNQPAIIWEPNDPEEHHRVLTYRQLHAKVVQFANVLKITALKKATVFVSIWEWCLNWPLPCWPAPVLAPFIA
jgi:acetyl-coenzyme A synthetase (EC 6.2.1.1)